MGRSQAGWLALAMLVGACGQGTKAPKSYARTTETSLDGYADLKLGMSFDEATAAVAGYSFDPSSLKECLAQLAVRGCILRAANDLTTYRTVEGVPYGLELAFNSHDKLTDIYLVYARNGDRDPAEEISKADCLAIYGRTMDWAVARYGHGFAQRADKPSPPNRKTPNGNEYFINDEGGAVVSILDNPARNGRITSVMLTFFKIGARSNCEVDVIFQEPRSVERWKLPPDEQATFDRTEKDSGAEAEAVSTSESDDDSTRAESSELDD